MAKTVMIGNSNTRHLSVSNRHRLILCAATRPVAKGDRRLTDGDVTCGWCKTTLKQAVENVLA